MDYFNLKLGEWEPFVEVMDVSLTQDMWEQTVTMLWFYGWTNINITTEMIEVVYSLYKDWKGPQEEVSDVILMRDASAEQSPYVVRNMTGIRIQIQTMYGDMDDSEVRLSTVSNMGEH